MDESGQTSGLTVHAGYWLRLVSNQVSQALKFQIERRGVTVAEWVALRVLFDENTAHASRLAEVLGMTRGAISKLLDRLVEKKLVACRVEREDRRYQCVSLTTKGRKLVPDLTEIADRNDEAFFGSPASPDRILLIAVLQRIASSHALRVAPVE